MLTAYTIEKKTRKLLGVSMFLIPQYILHVYTHTHNHTNTYIHAIAKQTNTCSFTKWLKNEASPKVDCWHASNGFRHFLHHYITPPSPTFLINGNYHSVAYDFEGILVGAMTDPR